MILSARFKLAFKAALAMVIVYGISLGMGWKNPYWGGFAVAMISLSTAGQSLNKGAMRMLGTLVAAAAALISIAWFAQDRWWFIGTLSIYIGFCTYMTAGNKRQYFWFCCAFISLVICVHAAGDMPNAFNIAVLRTQQTGMGILVYTMVSVLLWPTSSRGMLDEATRKLFATQATIYRTYRALLSGQGTVEDSRPLRMQEIQLLSQRAQALNAAETDSYRVWEVRHQWRRFHRLSTDLMEVLEQWRESFSEIQPLDLTKIFTNIESVLLELDDRFTEIERMLTDEAQTRTPKPISLMVNHKGTIALTHFQKAAVAVTKNQLDRLEALSRTLLDCLGDIRGDGRQSSSPISPDTRAGVLGLDPDRLIASVRAMATLWAGFLIWVYVDPAGHESFVLIATILAIAAAMLRLNPAIIFTPLMVLTLLAGVVYVFVMPHLSGYAQLGAMIFGAIFAIFYLFWQPHQALAKMIGAAAFLKIIDVQNQQTYSFAGLANTVVAIALAAGLVIAMWYIPPSPRPEKVFLSLMARFYRHSEHLISRMALDFEQAIGWTGRWKILFYRNDLLELPQKLAVLSGQIDHRLFPGTTPEQVQTLVSSLRALAFRLKNLVDLRQYPQAPLLVRELLDDMRAWRMVIEELLRNWSDDPASEPDGNLHSQLATKLEKMETRINQTLSLDEQEKLSEQDFTNLYRLIGSYRGLSESIVEHAKLVGNFDWGKWKEARF